MIKSDEKRYDKKQQRQNSSPNVLIKKDDASIDEKPVQRLHLTTNFDSQDDQEDTDREIVKLPALDTPKETDPVNIVKIDIQSNSIIIEDNSKPSHNDVSLNSRDDLKENPDASNNMIIQDRDKLVDYAFQRKYASVASMKGSVNNLNTPEANKTWKPWGQAFYVLGSFGLIVSLLSFPSYKPDEEGLLRKFDNYTIYTSLKPANDCFPIRNATLSLAQDNIGGLNPILNSVPILALIFHIFYVIYLVWTLKRKKKVANPYVVALDALIPAFSIWFITGIVTAIRMTNLLLSSRKLQEYQSCFNSNELTSLVQSYEDYSKKYMIASLIVIIQFIWHLPLSCLYAAKFIRKCFNDDDDDEIF